MKRFLRYSLSAFSILLLSMTSNAQVPGAGTSYDFANNHMIAPNTPSLNPTTITIEAWIKADTWASNSWENVIVSKDGWASGDQGYVLRAGANGTLSFNFSGGGTWKEVTSTPTMAVGKWYHVAGSFDGTTLRVYINGEEVGTTAYTGTITNGNYDLYIGRAAYTIGGTRYFDGNIDEVRIWNTAIPQTALQDYMCQKINASHPNLGSLAAHYSFDNPGFLMDSSPNGNNLTNFGATQVTSGAAIGDESVHEYGTPYNLSLAYSTIDSINVQSTNSMSTIHLYRVDMAPNTLNAASTIDSMDYSHYYGVYVGSSASYTYTMAYNYYGNPMGLTNGAYLNLAGRTDATTPSWAPQGATVNEPTTTVNKTFTNRSEVMLAIACKQINLNVSGILSLCEGETFTALDQASNTNYQWHNGIGPISGETNFSYSLSVSGDYYLVANDGLCIDTSAVINLTVNPFPTVDFGTLSSTHCENDAVSPILNPTPSGGLYAGSGITGTDFDPNSAGAGTHVLYYDYTDGNNCSASDSMTVEVFPQPTAPTITNTAGILCADTPIPGAQYEWSLGGVVVATGIDPCYTPTANGDYTVTCTNSDGCTSDDSAIEIVSGIGINEHDLLQAISVSPNPTNGLLTVAFEGLNSEVFIALRDVNGRIISTKSGISLIEFDLSDLDAGVYFIDCEIGEQRVVKRVVKE